MTRVELDALIDQWENAKVDFKRELWNVKLLDNIEDKNKKKELQNIITFKKNELLKDIFSLTNGDVYSTEKTAYLIIGVDDKTKEICTFDINSLAKDYSLEKFKKELLQWLNNYAQPEFLALEMEFLDEVLVISIPPRGSLISLSKDLKLKNKRGEYVDKKGTTYYRIGEDIRVASTDVIKDFEKAFIPKSQIELPLKKDPKHLTSLPDISTDFIGRKDDLEEIKKNLDSNNVVCVVKGIGGIGKSELVCKYFHEHKDEYKKIAFIEFSEESYSLENVFRREFQDSLYLKADDNFTTIIRRLQALPLKNLLLVDNILSNDDFKKIKSLNINFDILVTTRAKLDSKNILNLETLNNTDAKALFLDIYPTEEKIDDILNYLDNHPLFIKLIAFSLKNKFTRLSYLREDIRDGKIAKINSEDSKTFKAHLQKRFDQQFKKEENSEVKKMLQTLALFPAIEIDIQILEKLFDNNRIEGELQLLVNSGWLINKEDSYKLHQIIKLFMLEEYPVEYADVTFILENIGNYIDPRDSELIASQLSNYIPIIDSLLELELFRDKTDEPIAKILDSNTFFYYSLGEYDNSLKMQKKSLEIREKLYENDSIEIAKNYNLLGIIYRSKGEYAKAEPLFEKALKIREELLGENHSDTANSYNNLATLYNSKGEYAKAKPLYEKSLKIAEDIFGKNHSYTALGYNNLASLYESKGKYTKAELLHEKALKIKEEVLGEKHPSLAISYWNLGLFYRDRKLCSKAKELLEKCIEVVETLDYFEITLLEIRRALKGVNDSLKKEKKVKFKDKGRYCVD